METNENPAETSQVPVVHDEPAPKTLMELMAEKYPKTKTEPCVDCPEGRTAWGHSDPI